MCKYFFVGLLVGKSNTWKNGFTKNFKGSLRRGYRAFTSAVFTG